LYHLVGHRFAPQRVGSQSCSRILAVGCCVVTPFAAVKGMGVDHRGAHVLVAKQFLHRADIVSVRQQVRSIRMPERVTGDSLGQLGLPCSLLDCLLDERFVNMVSTLLTGSLIQQSDTQGRLRSLPAAGGIGPVLQHGFVRHNTIPSHPCHEGWPLCLLIRKAMYV
jgi:hypothetical protein